MKYYLTFFDEKYSQHAERLFELLHKYSKYKIIAVSLNYNYLPKYDNIISIRHDINELSDARNKFIKASICKNILDLYIEDDICFLDADILPLPNCDDIFEHFNQITDYPIVARHMYDSIKTITCDKDYEENLFNYLNLDYSVRRNAYTPYLQNCIFIFNKKCYELINKWSFICQDEHLINNYTKYCIVYDETILNALLWNKRIDMFFDKIQIDINNNVNIEDIFNHYKNPKDNDLIYSDFIRIPCKNDISKVKFFHGRLDDNNFKIYKNMIEQKFNLPIEINHRDMLPIFFEKFKLKNKGVEVGSWKGIYANQILRHWSGKLYLVDVWKNLDIGVYSDQSNQFDYKNIIIDCIDNIKNHEDRCFMIRCDSKNAAELFDDESLDFVYIDANHKYEFVKEDISLWYPKVRKGGIVAGHDYLKLDWGADNYHASHVKDKHIWVMSDSGKYDIYNGEFGVNPAIEEFCKENNYDFKVTEEWFGTWYFIKK